MRIEVFEDEFDSYITQMKIGKMIFEIGEDELDRGVIYEVKGRVENFMKYFRHITCRLPLQDVKRIKILEDVGFRFSQVIMQGEVLISEVLKDLPEEDFSSISEIGEKDLEFVVNAFPGIFYSSRFFSDEFLRPFAEKAHREWILRLIMGKGADKVFGVFDKNPVAFMAVKVEEREGEKIGFIPLYATYPEKQNIGLAKKLYNFSLRWFLKNGVGKARGQINAWNFPSLNAAIKMGFKATASFIDLSIY